MDITNMPLFVMENIGHIPGNFNTDFISRLLILYNESPAINQSMPFLSFLIFFVSMFGFLVKKHRKYLTTLLLILLPQRG